MLAELHLENLLLISDVRIEFATGLNALTGETGAGKSLLVDALNFLLGARGDASLVRPGAAQAAVSARFFLSDRELVQIFRDELGIAFDADGLQKSKSAAAELVVSRILPKDGRARAHANGKPIALGALKELGERLLDIHGQHENQSLLRPLTRLEILDRFAAAATERAAVRQAHAAALDTARELHALRLKARNRQGHEDLLRFQLKELDETRLDDLSANELQGEVQLLRSAEKISAAADLAVRALDGDDGESAATLLGRAAKAFHALGEAGPDAAAISERIDGLLVNLRELSRDAAGLAERARSDPERLAELEEQWDRYRSLVRKHGHELDGLRALRDKLRTEADSLERIDSQTAAVEKAVAQAVVVLRSACEKLTRKRQKGAKDFERLVGKELTDLGLKAARLEVHLQPHAPALSPATAGPEADAAEGAMLPAQFKATGAEGMELLFSANPEIAPRPLQECASGGEISRVMLALKGVLARQGGADRLPVVVFDEIDSGVGGRLGGVLGNKLSELARVRQVICVTHQPQIAAFAQRQFKVDKSRRAGSSQIEVELLEGDRRVGELAVMLRGEAASQHTRDEAAVMLEEAQAGHAQPAKTRRNK